MTAVAVDRRAWQVQVDRLRTLEPRLAGVSLAEPTGELRIACGHQRAYAAVGWSVRWLDEDDPSRAWNPDVSAPAAPLVLPTADSAEAARSCDSLLDRWVAAVARETPDAVATVLWPTADAWAGERLGAAGFARVGALAVRPPGGLPRVRPEVEESVSVRRGLPGDLDAAAALHREEVEYDASLEPGGRVLGVEQRSSRERMAAGLRGEGRSVVHLVVVDGEPVAGCESWHVEVAGHKEEWLSTVLPPGRYAYLNTVCVTAAYRGRGIGGLLVREVLRDMDGADGTYLWYSDLNPVSPGFWQAMGYRPLWTRYHRRPWLA